MLASEGTENNPEYCWMCYDCYVKARVTNTDLFFKSDPKEDAGSIVDVSYRKRTCCFCAESTERSCCLHWVGTRIPLPRYQWLSVVPEHLEFHYPRLRLNAPELDALHELLDTMNLHGYAVNVTTNT